jgi:hypothetical protein
VIATGYPPEAVTAPRPPLYAGARRPLAWFVVWAQAARYDIRVEGIGYASGYVARWRHSTPEVKS